MSVSLDSYVVKHQVIDVWNENNTLVPAVTGKQIWVLKVVLISNGSVTATFQSGTGGANITGPFYLVANTGFALAQEEGQYVSGHFKTRTSQLLNLNLSSNVQVGGFLSYIEVDGSAYSSSSSSVSSSSSSCRSSSSSSSSSSCRSSSSSSRSSSSSSSSSSCRSSSSSSSCRSSSSSSQNP